MNGKIIAISFVVFALVALATLIAIPVILSTLAWSSHTGVGISVGQYIKWVTVPTGLVAVIIYLVVAWRRSQ